METGRLKSEFNILKCYLIFHLILIILIITCHIITHTAYLFINKTLLIGYYVGISLYIIIFINSLVSNIIMFRKKYTPTMINKFKNIMKNIAVLCIIKGIILSAMYWFNFINYDSFIRNCPFSFSSEKMTNLIEKSKSNKIKDICQLKRCFFNNEYLNNAIKKYDYICNYNAYNSYLHNQKKDLTCKYIIPNEFANNYNPKKLSYFPKCNKYDNFFLCSTREKRHDNKFKLEEDLKCPNNYKKIRIIILGVLFPVVDIGADLVVILFTFCQYNIIIKLINLRNILGERYTPSSLNSTKDNSIIINNNINNNILPELNIMTTEIYISQTLLENNTNINNNISNNNVIKNINKNNEEIKMPDIDSNNKSLSESNHVLINSKNELMNLEEDKNNNTNIKK